TEPVSFSTITLAAGTIVYHGTSEEFSEEDDELEGPLWVSQSQVVAENFAKRHGGPRPRVLELEIVQTLTLPSILSIEELQELAEHYGIDLTSAHDIVDS